MQGANLLNCKLQKQDCGQVRLVLLLHELLRVSQLAVILFYSVPL